MNSVQVSVCAALGAAVLSAGGASAGTYTLITPYAGVGTTTSIIGINDAGYMTGSINNADGTADGFIRDPAGAYTLFNTGYDTFGRNISNANTITGYATDSTGNLRTDTTFVRAAGGVITALTDPTTSAPINGIAQGQNAAGAIVGDYFYTTGGHNYRHGFDLVGGTFTDISAGPSFGLKTTARGINDSGTIVGWTLDANTGLTQGYVDVGGVMSFFTDPDPAAAGTTYFEDINNAGLVVGEYLDAATHLHPFEFDSVTHVFTDLTPPPVTDYDAFGLNSQGEIVLAGSNGANYLYDPTGVPEPAGWALMLIGLSGIGAVLRRRAVRPLTV